LAVSRHAWLVALVALTAASCKPREGKSCRGEGEGKLVCASASSALVCRDGVWKVATCRGADGCQSVRSSGDVVAVLCDQSRVEPGDVCAPEPRSRCTSPSTLEGCKDGVWRRVACGDGRVCTAGELGAMCVEHEERRARAGAPDASAQDGAKKACALDKDCTAPEMCLGPPRYLAQGTEAYVEAAGLGCRLPCDPSQPDICPRPKRCKGWGYRHDAPERTEINPFTEQPMVTKGYGVYFCVD
jgi:hypothetical protein